MIEIKCSDLIFEGGTESCSSSGLFVRAKKNRFPSWITNYPIWKGFFVQPPVEFAPPGGVVGPKFDFCHVRGFFWKNGWISLMFDLFSNLFGKHCFCTVAGGVRSARGREWRRIDLWKKAFSLPGLLVQTMDGFP